MGLCRDRNEERLSNGPRQRCPVSANPIRHVLWTKIVRPGAWLNLEQLGSFGSSDPLRVFKEVIVVLRANFGVDALHLQQIEPSICRGFGYMMIETPGS